MHAATMLRASVAVGVFCFAATVAALRPDACSSVTYKMRVQGDHVFVDAHPRGCACIMKGNACACASSQSCSSGSDARGNKDTCKMQRGDVVKGAKMLLGCGCVHSKGSCDCHKHAGACGCSIDERGAKRVMDDIVQRVQNEYPALNARRGTVEMEDPFQSSEDVRADAKLTALQLALSDLRATAVEKETIEKIQSIAPQQSTLLSQPLTLATGAGAAVLAHKVLHMSAEERKAQQDKLVNVARNIKAKFVAPQPIVVT